MTLKIGNLMKGIFPIIITFLLIYVIFSLLVYAIPAAFIIWALYTLVKKVKGKLHERKHFSIKNNRTDRTFSDKVNHDIFNQFDLTNKKIIDVEYEDINNQ